MKNSHIITFFFLSALCLSSCQNDDDVPNSDVPDFPGPKLEGTLMDGGQISGIGFYCDDYSLRGDRTYKEHWAETKTVKDYGAFRLILDVEQEAGTYQSGDSAEMSAVRKYESEYCKEKSSFIIESYRKHGPYAAWPELLTAYLNGDFTITCDKPLFGQQPGTNLSQHFTFTTVFPCVPVGVETPHFLYDYGESQNKTVSSIFVKGVWLTYRYYFEFTEQPSEKYDEITLHITMPIQKEHVSDIAAARYKTGEFAPKFSEVVYQADCQIKFNR